MISNAMADRFRDVVFPALDFAQSGERKCLLVVATYGTGKTHLMSVITLVAERAELVAELKNPRSHAAAAKIAGTLQGHPPTRSARRRCPCATSSCGMLEAASRDGRDLQVPARRPRLRTPRTRLPR